VGGRISRKTAAKPVAVWISIMSWDVLSPYHL